MRSRLATAIRSAAFVTAAVVSAGRTEAQVPPRFPTQAELVTVDVVVLGPDGKPVPGLTRGDFVVKEDGRPQAIAAFEAVEAVVPALESPETVRSSPSQARVATNVAGPPTRRTFAIVFDDLHVNDLDIEEAKRAVETFVAREGRPGDRLVLFTTSDARYWATTRAGADDAFMQALRRIRSHERKADPFKPFPMMHYEAMRIEEAGDERVLRLVQRRLGVCRPSASAGGTGARRGRAEQTGGQDEPPIRHCSEAAEIYALERGRLGSTLRVVREVIRSLAPVAGRKSLVLVTTGFPVDPTLDVFREVRDHAARANVALTYLDARGLPVPPLLSAANSMLPEPDVALLWRMNEEGPKTLADETGGVVLQTNDLAGGLATVAAEMRVTYLLGYEPTNEKRDGRYRRLKVEVRQPGLQVRARAGYFAAKGNGKPAPKPTPVQRAVGQLFDADAIPLRLAAYVMGPAPVQSPVPTTGFEVLIAGELRLDALEAQMKGGRRVARPSLKLLTGSRGGESHESEWTLEITLAADVGSYAPADAKSSDGEALWHPFVTRVAMTPGDHRARLVVQSGERIGSVTVDFVVPSPTDERLSTPILSDRLMANASEYRLLPLARRAFDASSTLHCWVELHGAALDTATGLPRAQADFVLRSLDGRELARGPATAMNVEGARATRLISVPLADAPPGEHELVLRVTDEVSGATFEASEPFRVDAAGGAHKSPRPPDRADTLSPPSSGVVTVSTGAPQPAATQAAAPQPAPPALPAAAPTFPAETQVVLLDLVARDGRGRLVSDLRADELQVFEDGKRCEVQSFRLVRSADTVESGPGLSGPQTSPSALPQPEPSAPSQANLVVLFFESPYGRQAALDLLGRSFPPNTWFAVFLGPRAVQTFTSDRDSLRAAVLGATTDVPVSPWNALELPSPQKGLPLSRSRTLIAPDLERELSELRSGVRELDSFLAIQAIARSLAAVRGRKTVLYFAEDHQLGGGEISGGRASLVYDAAMSDANRANVTIHTVDLRGLTTTRVGGRGPLEQAMGQYSAGGLTGGGQVGGPMLEAAGFLSYKSGSLLEHVAEETGGLAIRNTNDPGAGLARVIDELREYYEVVYTPPNPVPDGRFRRIQAKVERRGVQVRTRAGYFATPATAPTLAAFELTLIAALTEKDPPRAFPHDVRLVPHAPRDGDREVEFLAEVPLGAVEIATDAARGTYTAHLSFVAFIKDETGRSVVRLSEDWPVEGRLDQAGRSPQTNLVFRRVMSLPPGRYTVESAIQDRGTGRISVARTPADIAPASSDGAR